MAVSENRGISTQKKHLDREHDDKPPSFGGNLFLDNTKEMVDLEKIGNHLWSQLYSSWTQRDLGKSGFCHGKSIYKWMI